MNQITVAKVLLTIAAIQFGVVPPLVDFTASHVFNLDWTPHARLHMVWLLTTGGLLAMYTWLLVWLPGKRPIEKLRYACVPGWIVLLGFFVATITRDIYGGGMADTGHDMQIMGVSGNVFAFSIAALFQATATIIIWRRT